MRCVFRGRAPAGCTQARQGAGSTYGTMSRHHQQRVRSSSSECAQAGTSASVCSKLMQWHAGGRARTGWLPWQGATPLRLALPLPAHRAPPRPPARNNAAVTSDSSCGSAAAARSHVPPSSTGFASTPAFSWAAAAAAAPHTTDWDQACQRSRAGKRGMNTTPERTHLQGHHAARVLRHTLHAHRRQLFRHRLLLLLLQARLLLFHVPAMQARAGAAMAASVV